MVDQAFVGGCLCGAIRYESSPPVRFVVCHCRDCQYSSGGAPAHVVVVPKGGLAIDKGREKLRSFTSTADSGNSVTRQFCAECGTPMFESLQMAPAIQLVKVGTIDDASHLKVDTTAWTASAQPWALVDPATQLCSYNPTPRAEPESESEL